MRALATRRFPRRARRLGAVLATTGALGLALSGCGGSGSDALGHKACVEVSRSLRTYAAAASAPSPARAAADRGVALSELRDALQPAALAGSSDGQWQALEATLSESSRVPESDLVIALTAQCAQTLSHGS
ncbi:MAG: hypothetical protein JWO62_1831 [Acidimicrobiaceae bacterium]|nr:hypothetical protein [Acidimicrobiaceae bacterium]